MENQLSELGISISVFDSKDDGYEDSDILKAIIIANQGKAIPDDLKERIRNKSIHKDDKKEKPNI